MARSASARSMLLSVRIMWFLSILYLTSAFLLPDDVCQLENPELGVCKHLYECVTAVETLKMGKRPKTCGFDRFIPVVCCPLNESPVGRVKPGVPDDVMVNQDYGKVSFEKCKNYAGLVFHNYSSPTLLPGVLFEIEDTCAIKKENYNESSVLAREFPHLASIGYDLRSDRVWKCSGALISEKHILTAATCSKLPLLGSAKYVRLGSTSVRENFYHEKPLQYINIQEFIKHPGFDRLTLANNLAVVKLEGPVKFTSIVRPACLGVSRKRREDAIHVGWGTLNNNDFLNNEPLKNLMKIVDPARCTDQKYNQFCVEQVPGTLWQNCLLDQGSVLQVYNDDNYCTYDIIGVLANWEGCFIGRPGTYTNVTIYIPWIEKTVWG